MRIFYGNFGSETLFRCGFVKGKYDFPQHIHQFAEICYRKSGSLELTIDGETEVMEKGDMAIIPPYRVQVYYTPKTVERWICVFSDNFIPSFVGLDKFVASPKKHVFHPDSELILFLENKPPATEPKSSVSGGLFLIFLLSITNEELYPEFRLFFPGSNTAFQYNRRFFSLRSSLTDRGSYSSGIPKRAFRRRPL